MLGVAESVLERDESDAMVYGKRLSVVGESVGSEVLVGLTRAQWAVQTMGNVRDLVAGHCEKRLSSC